MSQFFKVAELEKLNLLTVYRMLLKNLKHYPSVNRYSIMVAVQDQFRENAALTAAQKKQKFRKKAYMGLRHVLYYIEKNEHLKQNKYHNFDQIEPMAKSKYNLPAIKSLNMLALKRLRLCFKMCQITSDVYDNLFKQFNKTLDLSTLGKYYKSENLVEVYNIVKHTRMKPSDKISFYNQIEEQICKDNTDMELNILANMYRDKSIIYEQHGQSAEAVVEIEKAVKAIQSMDQPFNLEVASLMQNAANLHIKFKNYSKALKFLKDAEHMLNTTEEELLQNQTISGEAKQGQIKEVNALMAKIMSQFCLIHLQLMHPFESKSYLNKALERWKNIENKNNMAYLMTIKFKCILHSWLKEENLAVQTAKQYLKNNEPTQETVGHRLWFMKFLIDKGFDTYTSELKQSIEELSKVLSQKDLSDFLTKIGVIKKPKNEPQKSK